jgi:leader peptidase (prepilin peptidase)/N-methyltransferase
MENIIASYEHAVSSAPQLRYFILLLIFSLGLCVGSFLNVVIHRLPLGESVVKPRSRCPKCKSLIPWYRNLPLISYVWLRGKCGDCGIKISLRYPLVELLTALLFTLTAYLHFNFLYWPFQFYFLAALVASTFIDLDHWIIPDKITLPGIVIGFLGSFLLPNMPWIGSLAGIIAGGGILYLVAWAYRAYAGRDGIGGGDIKFLAMTGAFLGAQGALVTLVLSSALGSVLGIFLLVVRKKSGGTAIPFGPFLALGALAAFLFGERLWQWYFNFH